MTHLGNLDTVANALQSNAEHYTLSTVFHALQEYINAASPTPRLTDDVRDNYDKYISGELQIDGIKEHLGALLENEQKTTFTFSYDVLSTTQICFGYGKLSYNKKSLKYTIKIPTMNFDGCKRTDGTYDWDKPFNKTTCDTADTVIADIKRNNVLLTWLLTTQIISSGDNFTFRAVKETARFTAAHEIGEVLVTLGLLEVPSVPQTEPYSLRKENTCDEFARAIISNRNIAHTSWLNKN
ncbi:MAG: hypothetical protein LBN42_03905 [Oscillospiraceae bacterium]|jgi:hypothetical protein|nr:hypothetical protein [Oscillospiraceae bacterium]